MWPPRPALSPPAIVYRAVSHLNTPTREISPDRGIHMVRLAGLYTSVSSGLSGLWKCRPVIPFGRLSSVA